MCRDIYGAVKKCLSSFTSEELPGLKYKNSKREYKSLIIDLNGCKTRSFEIIHPYISPKIEYVNNEGNNKMHKEW